MRTDEIRRRIRTALGTDSTDATVSRYDLVLAVVPLAFLLGGLTSVVAGVPVQRGVLGGAAVGLLAVADALFLNPPGGGCGGRGVA